MRRPSLVEEIKDKDPQFASTRLKSVLNTITEKERHEIMVNYDRKSHQFRDKNFFLASLIDAFFDRKERGKDKMSSTSSSTSNHQTYPPPLSGSRSSIPLASVSAPTLISKESIGENRVCDYRFIKTLGKGTFGKVKLAEHIVTKQLVAIKIIEKANIKTTKQKVSVDREVRLMKLLHHPHIVGVLDVYESADNIWIVMENASGGELFEYIVKHGLVKEPEARRFFRQILSAVEYCHQNSVIHRDLKPENLLLDDQCNIKIIDFGFGNTFHRDCLLDTYCGSPFYAAPEMIQGIRYVGPEVDVWSLGVILYALLAGRLPFDAGSMNELYEKIARGKYTCPSHFSPMAINLIGRMLVTDPKKRASLAEIKQHVWVREGFANPIDSYVADRPVTVPNPSPDSLMELVSYGFKEHEVLRVLKTEMNLHPVVSLYHLIDEARRRKLSEEEYVRKNSLATIESVESTQQNLNTKKQGKYFGMVKNRKTTPDEPSHGQMEQVQQEINRMADAVLIKTPNRPKRRSSNPTYASHPSEYLEFSQDSSGFSNMEKPPICGVSNVVATSEPRLPSKTPVLVGRKMSLRDIFVEVERVLMVHRVQFAKSSAHAYTCDDNGCRFAVEIVPVQQDHFQQVAHEIRFKKIHAFWSWNHKAVFGKLIKDLRIE